MKTTRLTFFAVALIGASSLVGCRGMKSSQPPIHPNPNMDNVTRIEAQEPSDFWSDGRGMRPEVPGTVAVGELRSDTHLYEGKVNGQWTSAMPAQVSLTRETLVRGQERYEIYCTPCHGEAGLENGGIVPRRGMDAEWSWNVVSLHGAAPRGYRIGEMYDVVTNGVRTMPGYAAQIPVEDRWAIAGYVRAMQVAHGMPREAVPSNVRSEQGWN
ncbi:MAG: mono/diheme cytochrome c family protein [Bradymonadia bacterium]|jgi:mono/diheme cytochrome c family protein